MLWETVMSSGGRSASEGFDGGDLGETRRKVLAGSLPLTVFPAHHSPGNHANLQPCPVFFPLSRQNSLDVYSTSYGLTVLPDEMKLFSC